MDETENWSPAKTCRSASADQHMPPASAGGGRPYDSQAAGFSRLEGTTRTQARLKPARNYLRGWGPPAEAGGRDRPAEAGPVSRHTRAARRGAGPALLWERAGLLIIGMSLALSIAPSCSREDHAIPDTPPSAIPTPADIIASPTSEEVGHHSVFDRQDTSATRPEAVAKPESSPHMAIPATNVVAATQRGVPPFRPLADAHIGEWAEYVALDGRTLRYEIVQADEARVGIRVAIMQRGRHLGLPAIREEPRDFDPCAKAAAAAKASRHAEPAVVQAAGRTWQATLYEDKWVGEDVQYRRRTWVSRNAPVFGTIRMELYGDGELEARQELSAYGSR